MTTSKRHIFIMTLAITSLSLCSVHPLLAADSETKIMPHEEVDIRSELMKLPQKITELRRKILMEKRAVLKDKDVLKAKKKVQKAQEAYNDLIEKKLKKNPATAALMKELKQHEEDMSKLNKKLIEAAKKRAEAGAKK